MKPSVLGAWANEAGAELLKSFRAPEFIIPTVALPVAFYSLFGVAITRGEQANDYMLATYGVFAVMGPAIFGFGAGVANERDRGWLKLKRAAPAPAVSYVGAKLFATLVFATLALLLIYTVAGFVAGVELPRTTWLLLLGVHLASAVPFVLIGLTLGFSMGSNGAIAVSNIVFLAMSALGGLWLPIFILPAALQSFATVLPSYHLGEIALSIVAAPGERVLMNHLVAIAAMTATLACVTLFAWLRQRD